MIDSRLIAIVATMADGASMSSILTAIDGAVGDRTVRRRVAALVASGRLHREGERRWARYRVPTEPATVDPGEDAGDVRLSSASGELLDRVSRALVDRPEARFRAEYLEGYEPGRSVWLTAAERAHLRRLGTVADTPEPAGTYARRIADRLLIDLSWNSSRLEGNTYSLLDTRRLIALDVEAPGHDPREARMIRNHRNAIEFLLTNVGETGFDRLTITNLHALLASELLPDPSSPGRLRRMAVGIGGSSYAPSALPDEIEIAFDALLVRLAAIADPFEQSLVTLAHLPYLQPFDDVNKRVSRLAANLPMIRENLVPISFVGVARELYVKALLAVYELNDHRLLKDVFIHACERSAEHYREVRQTLGEPDPFRLRYIDRIAELVGEAVRDGLRLPDAAAVVRAWAAEHAAPADVERFREMAEGELLGLDEHNFARFRLRPSEYRRWRELQDSARGTSRDNR